MHRFLPAVLALVALAAASAAGDGQPLQAHPGQVDTFRVISDAKARVFPALVFIKPVVETYQRGEREAQEVTGSGVLISPDGEVVTNYHVVERAVSIRCLLYDGRHFEATVVGTDKDTDLALLKLDLRGDDALLPYAILGNSEELTEGDFVMAMGAPWGLNRSVSLGIVSCTGRYIPDHSEYSLWLQTDAALNPGNSGGPLVNTSGEVVGISTMATMLGGNLGFAVPSSTVEWISSHLRSDGEVIRTWTGLRLQPLRDFNRNMYFDVGEGVIVAGADPASPAELAGFRAGDRIVRVGQTPVTAVTDIDLPAVRSRLAMLPAEQDAAFEVYRDGQLVTLTVVPTIKGTVEGEELDLPRWNMTVKTINRFDNPDLYFVRNEGIFIYGTRFPGNAVASGLRSNDIITGIDGRPVTTLEQALEIYEAVISTEPRRTRVVIEYVRGGTQRQAVLDFSRDYGSN